MLTKYQMQTELSRRDAKNNAVLAFIAMLFAPLSTVSVRSTLDKPAANLNDNSTKRSSDSQSFLYLYSNSPINGETGDSVWWMKETRLLEMQPISQSFPVISGYTLVYQFL
jgi:hypothetical protein